MVKIRGQLGDLELAVMNILWDTEGPIEVGEVVAALGHSRAYTTVMTTLSRLHEKGYLHQERDGRAYRYSPLVSRAHVLQNMWRRISNILSDGDMLELIPHLLGKSGRLSEKDRRMLKRMAENIKDAKP